MEKKRFLMKVAAKVIANAITVLMIYVVYKLAI